jgi:hypothetical protein
MKQLYKRKKRAYDVFKAKQLCGLTKADPAAFWKQYHKRVEGVNGITSEALKDGFQQLLQPPTAPATVGAVAGAAIKAQVVSFPPNGIDCEQLNVDITLVEVQQAFKKLKRHKATGIDDIKPEFLLDAADALQQPLLIIFNKILREGYCESLSIGIIHALYKGGDYSQFDNYRGITVGPILAKVFVMILESRINQRAKTNDLRAKGQAGFIKDFRTTDNLFILRTLTEQARFLKKQLYTCFVDFKKAFDTATKGPVVAGAGGTWHQWADTGVLALHVPSRPCLPAPSRGRAHAHFLLPHQSEARMPPQPTPVWPLHRWHREAAECFGG